MSEPLSIRKAIERLVAGTIRIPGFQRTFVWEPERAALLMDSLYKGYPVGSLLLWRTRSRLKTERKLGVFELPPPDKDYPVDYVLDGQQRLTSIFTTFQNELSGTPNPDIWLPIYYDFASQVDAQESRFVALLPDDVDKSRHFPLRVFLDAVEFSDVVQDLPRDKKEEIVAVQARFIETMIPVQTFESEDRASVAIVFERVNRMGVELDIFQLLTAWTWSDEFDLQEKFRALSEEFESFGFGEVGQRSDLMLRCTAAILQQDPSPTALVNLNGGDVRASFATVEKALRLAVDFLRVNLSVHDLRFLPYESMLIPLAAFFSVDQSKSITSSQTKALKRWFWRSSFSHRYSGNPQRNIKNDIVEAVALRTHGVSKLGDFACDADPTFFLQNAFSLRTVASKAFVLLLAELRPLSFKSGQEVVLSTVLAEPNRGEFHHCYPKARLLKEGVGATNALANFAIISRAENREISDKAPSEYRSMMPADAADILKRAAIPESLFEDDYGRFVAERANALAQHVERLIA